MQQGIRPFNSSTDMLAVLDLIDIGFRGELDPQGQKMLAEMRSRATPGLFATQAYGAPSVGEAGFVWVEDERIVGNLSLRHAIPRRSNGRLIGNVVVHPDYRGRGIARALMTAAVDLARKRVARWVGLEVRADNEVAGTLYQHLGFHGVGQTFHLLRPFGEQWPAQMDPRADWRRSRPKDSALWYALAEAVHTYDQRKVVEVDRSVYAFGGMNRRLDLWLGQQREQAWLCDQGPYQMAVHVKTDLDYHFHVWDILVHPSEREEWALEAAAKALQTTRRYRIWPTIAIIPDQPTLLHVLQGIGFRLHRTLLQMILEL